MTLFHGSRLPVGYAGWVEMLSIRHAGSRFARRDSVRLEWRRNVRIESNRKVPQTNRLSLGVLDMDGGGGKI